MKANQKFRGSDDAVSPVIAVILMVAITVVLAATVYVWVSGFGGSHNQPANNVALSSNAPIADGFKTFTVTAATASLRWSDITVAIDGDALPLARALQVDSECEVDAPETDADCDPLACATEDATLAADDATKALVCGGSLRKGGDDLVRAGDQLRIPATAGETLRLLDSEANSVIYTVTLG